MVKAPAIVRRIQSLSTLSIYTAASNLPLALMLWSVSTLSIHGASAQTSPETPRPSTAEEQLEEAQRNLLGTDILPIQLEVELEGQTEDASTWQDPAFNTYRLGPGDSVFFNVQRFPELNFQGTLDQEGNLIVPLAGLVNLEGLSVDQAAAVIESTLNRYVINPEVEAVLVAQRPVRITIAGEIVRPGLYPLGEPRLAVAIATAGGTTRLADLRDVRIRRQLADGSVMERNVDLYTPLRESNSVPDVPLVDGDAIVLTSLSGAESAEYDRYLVARTTLAQQQIVIRVLNYAGGDARGGGNIRAINLPSGSTFLDAIVTISPNPGQANLGDVALIRFDPVTGRAVAQEFHARQALLGDTSQNPPLEHNDVIVVGRNLIARIGYALNLFTQPFRDILGFLLFFDNLTESASDLFGPGEDNNDNDDN